MLANGVDPYEKQIIAGISLIACVALCAAVWPRNSEAEDLPAKQDKTAVNAEIEARTEETPHVFITEDIPALETEVVADSNIPIVVISAEKEAEKLTPTQTVQYVKPVASSPEPHNGDVRVVDGEKQIYLLGFGWLKDEGENIGTTVGNPGDELTGHKVGVMGGGTVAEDMYENGHKIGVMGGAESALSNSPSQQPSEPVITGDVIYSYAPIDMTEEKTIIVAANEKAKKRYAVVAYLPIKRQPAFA